MFLIFINIDLALLKNEILKTRPLPLFIAMALNIPHLYIKSFRWNYLLRQQNIFFSYWETFLIYLSSLYIGFITPGRMGEFVKAFYLKSFKNISLSKAFPSVLLDRLFDLYLLIILGFIGILKFNIFGKLSSAFFLLSIIFVMVPLIMLNRNFMKKLTKLLYNFAVLNKVKGKIEENFQDFYNGLYKLINPKLLVSGLLTCFGYLLFFIQCYLIVIAIGLSVNFITITLFMAITNLISFIPISISGLGTRDASLIYLFSLIELNPELAVSYALLVFITFFVIGGLMGAGAYWIKPLSLDRQIETQLKT